MFLRLWMLLKLLALFLLLPQCTVGDRAKSKSGRSKGPMECKIAAIGGTQTNVNTVPWLANVRVRKKDKCAGAIVTMSFILTAGKCVDGYKLEALKVGVGSSNRDASVIEADICDVLLHDLYKEKYVESNLALLRLCEPLKPSAQVKAIEVYKHTLSDQAVVSVSGWGSVRWFKTWGEGCAANVTNQLYRAEVRIYNVRGCGADWKQTYKLTDLTVCTSKSGNGTCSYDMGAPLTFQNKLVGILSRGGCSPKPDIYNNILQYTQWLTTSTKQ
ncbi:hypothetical protein KR018_005130 [Drosophila ironensis]|nr:hypothetical protein KR018_005130 [Drosophila ironensis]